MNPLNDYPSVRRVLYLIQWITTGITGAVGVVLTAQDSSPSWYVITVAVLAFVWTYLGVTAQTNTSTEPE